VIRVFDDVADEKESVADDGEVDDKMFRVLRVTSFCHYFLPAVVGSCCRRLQE
jgi:hypothetical protein